LKNKIWRNSSIIFIFSLFKYFKIWALFFRELWLL